MVRVRIGLHTFLYAFTWDRPEDELRPAGWSLIYRKLKSLIITYRNSNRSTCDYGEQRNSGDRGTVGTEERKAQRNTGHRGTVSAEEQ